MNEIVKDSQTWLEKKKQILVIRCIASLGLLIAAWYVGNILENYLASSVLLGVAGATFAGLLGYRKELKMHNFIAQENVSK